MIDLAASIQAVLLTPMTYCFSLVPGATSLTAGRKHQTWYNYTLREKLVLSDAGSFVHSFIHFNSNFLSISCRLWEMDLVTEQGKRSLTLLLCFAVLYLLYLQQILPQKKRGSFGQIRRYRGEE